MGMLALDIILPSMQHRQTYVCRPSDPAPLRRHRAARNVFQTLRITHRCGHLLSPAHLRDAPFRLTQVLGTARLLIRRQKGGA